MALSQKTIIDAMHLVHWYFNFTTLTFTNSVSTFWAISVPGADLNRHCLSSPYLPIPTTYIWKPLIKRCTLKVLVQWTNKIYIYPPSIGIIPLFDQFISPEVLPCDKPVEGLPCWPWPCYKGASLGWYAHGCNLSRWQFGI